MELAVNLILDTIFLHACLIKLIEDKKSFIKSLIVTFTHLLIGKYIQNLIPTKFSGILSLVILYLLIFIITDKNQIKTIKVAVSLTAINLLSIVIAIMLKLPVSYMKISTTIINIILLSIFYNMINKGVLYITEILKTMSWTSLLVNTTMIIILVAVLLDVYTRTNDTTIKNDITLLSSILIIYTINFIVIIKDNYTTKLKNKLLVQQNLFIKEYAKINENFKHTLHDYKNLMEVLCLVLNDKKLKDEEKITVIKDYYKKFNCNINIHNSILNITNPFLIGLFTKKLEYATRLEVELYIKATSVDIKNIDIIDLIECLSLLIDNAIEVAYYTELKAVDITIYEYKDLIDISIFNYKSYKDGNLLKYGNSNKVGLQSLKSIINKYDNVAYDIQETADYYNVSIKIKK